jgi:hypothetical protein
MAMVPLSEFRTPTLMPVPLVAVAGAAGLAAVVGGAGAAVLHAASNPATDTPSAAPPDARRNLRRFNDLCNIAQRYTVSSDENIVSCATPSARCFQTKCPIRW